MLADSKGISAGSTEEFLPLHISPSPAFVGKVIWALQTFSLHWPSNVEASRAEAWMPAQQVESTHIGVTGRGFRGPAKSQCEQSQTQKLKLQGDYSRIFSMTLPLETLIQLSCLNSHRGRSLCGYKCYLHSVVAVNAFFLHVLV